VSPATLADVEVRERVAHLEARLEALESLADPEARELALESVQMLLELYGEALTRVLRHAAGAGGEPLMEMLVADEWVAQLLLLHGLHPEDVELRVRRALEEVRPNLGSHGGSVELLRVEGGTAYLRLEGSCHGCPASTLTLRSSIEEAVRRHAPELEGVVAEGEERAKPTARAPELVQLCPAPTARAAP
jgi:Fe-S cluster biogenesis protein NfuA